MPKGRFIETILKVSNHYLISRNRLVPSGRFFVSAKD
jgi:hypothetical protein